MIPPTSGQVPNPPKNSNGGLDAFFPRSLGDGLFKRPQEGSFGPGVAAQENADDRDRHGTTARGAANGFAALTEAQVRAVRTFAERGMPAAAYMAAALAVHTDTIERVVSRLHYPSVADDAELLERLAAAEAANQRVRELCDDFGQDDPLRSHQPLVPVAEVRRALDGGDNPNE